MSYKEKPILITDQKIRLQGINIFETISDTISLTTDNERFKVKLFSGAGGGVFHIEAKEPIYLILPASADYTNILMSETSEDFKFKRL